MYAAPILCSAIQQTFPNLEKVTIVSPDVGGVVRARNLAKRLGVGIAIVDKRRSQPGVVDNMEIIGDVNGKICLICDDICDTAGTLVKAADCLKEHGSIAVHAYVSHGVLSEPAVERISTSELSSFTMTDSIDASEKIKNSEKIHCLSIAPLFAQAIINVSSDNSLSTLFHEKYVAPLYNSTIA
jgi:ribose-phosphate pyrophosphokinase